MKKVLIVDDEEDMIWSLQKNLPNKTLQVETLTASSGEEALETLGNTSVDLIVTDIKMPGMSGLDLLAEVKKHYPKLDVVFMTAYPSQECKQEALSKGGVSFIEKPFDINEMRNVIKNVLNSRENRLACKKANTNLDTLEIEFSEAEGNTTDSTVTTKPRDVQAVLSDEGSIEDSIVSTLLGFGDDNGIKLEEDELWDDGQEENHDAGSIEDNIVGTLLSQMGKINPSKSKPVAESQKADKPAAEKPAVESQKADKPAAEKPAAESQKADKPAAEKPAAESQKAGKPAAEKPAAESQKADKPVAEKPAVESQKENIPIKKYTDENSQEENKPVTKNPEKTKQKENKFVRKGPEKNKTKEEVIMAELQELLTEFTNIPGVSTVCLVGRDGFLLDSVARAGVETEMIGAIASSGFGTSESMGNQLEKGVLSMTMIEYEDGPVMLSPVGSDAFLVVVADKESNLGMIRLKIKKHSPEIQEAAAI